MSELKTPQLTKKDFVSDQAVRWCPGCGDYAILAKHKSKCQPLVVGVRNLFLYQELAVLADFPIT